jgi:hypothetical protein
MDAKDITNDMIIEYLERTSYAGQKIESCNFTPLGVHVCSYPLSSEETERRRHKTKEEK